MCDVHRNRAEWRRLGLTALLMVTVLGTSSCLFRKKQPRVFTPPPVAARVPPDTKPVVLPEPLEIPAQTPPAEEIPVAGLPPLPPPPKPAPAKTPPRRTPAAPNVDVVEPPPPAAPKPVQIYTAEERREFLRDMDDSLAKVRQALARVGNRNLSAELRDVLNRIQTFQRQAEEERDRDPAAAASLARRADLLAQDLLGRLR